MNGTHSKLVNEIVDLLLSKFEHLPPEERSMIAPATIEAAAWIVAMESTVYCKKNGCNGDEALARAAHFEQMFAAEIERDLAEHLHN